MAIASSLAVGRELCAWIGESRTLVLSACREITAPDWFSRSRGVAARSLFPAGSFFSRGFEGDLGFRNYHLPPLSSGFFMATLWVLRKSNPLAGRNVQNDAFYQSDSPSDF
jgi:hypothetical protein